MTERIKNFFQSTPLARLIGGILVCLAAIIFILFVFLIGESFGYHRAEFSYHMTDRYDDILGGPVSGPAPFAEDNMFAESHGASGTVVKAALPEIIVSDTDGVEKTVVLTDQTVIREFRGNTASTSISNGDQIIVIGSPDDQGRIIASLVRVVPANATSSVQ